ncbi:MAG TPA: hypothetical protein VMF70_12495 [Gemmatimonadales bacterium]|nr:hypothetical protein [Gemmatimonadales bacterium]
MQYFYRAHASPTTVLAAAEQYFAPRGLAVQRGAGDHARFVGLLGTVDLNVEIEGGHYVRVTLATRDTSRSELDDIAKRFLTELHALEQPGHAPRGAY